MGFLQDLTGKTAAKAAAAASQDEYRKQQAAVGKLLGYGEDYNTAYQGLGDKYDPYVQTGYAANDQYTRLLQDPSSVRSLPGYQFNLDQGTEALDRSKGARGLLNSGRSAKDLLRFGQGLADNTYGSQLDRLMRASSQGQGALQQQNATYGQGLTGRLGAQTTAYGGDYGSAGTIGQGMIAGANARAQGSQGLFNTGLNLAGKIFGMF